MRKLSPTKAVYHALNSVWTYRAVALRIGLVWVPVLLACGLVSLMLGPVDPNATGVTPQHLAVFATDVVSLAAVCSMAVSWHRFILRDEPPRGLRIDGAVLHYAGYSLLVVLPMLLPALFLAIGIAAPSAPALLIGAALFALFGGFITRLSVKLPAVALRNTGFTLRDALKASEGNAWPCTAVFLFTTLSGLLVLYLLDKVLGDSGDTAAQVVALVIAIPVQIVFALINASILTSLYGFFVERRDF